MSVCCVCSVVSHCGSFNFGIILCQPQPSRATQAHIQTELNCCRRKQKHKFKKYKFVFFQVGLDICAFFKLCSGFLTAAVSRNTPHTRLCVCILSKNTKSGVQMFSFDSSDEYTHTFLSTPHGHIVVTSLNSKQ